MQTGSSITEHLNAYDQAYSVIAPFIAHVQVLGLLQGACTAGILAAALSPVSVETIATQTGMTSSRVHDFCRALAAYGIFVKTRDQYRLTKEWALLVQSDVLRPFLVIIGSAFAKARAFSEPEAGYWHLPSEDRLMLARGVTYNPTSAGTPEFYEMLIHDMLPEVTDWLAHQETRYLELGCGVGGGLMGMLRLYPRLTAVAVDVAGDLLAEARSTAAALGLTDRVNFIHDDARNFDEHNAFDLVYWSQFFFPEPTRADALQVAYAALKPTGYLFAPLLTDPIAEEDLHTGQGQQYAMSRLLYGGWGVPAFSAADVKAEIEAAGFVNVQIREKPYLRLVVAQRSADYPVPPPPKLRVTENRSELGPDVAGRMGARFTAGKENE